MPQTHWLRRSIMAGALIALVSLPLPARAIEQPAVATQILITEIQTGQATASDEFVELYNAGAAAVDLGGWQVRYRNAADTATATSLLVAIPEGTVIAPSGYVLLHAPAVTPPAGVAAVPYAASLSVADKAIGLYQPHTATCILTVHDAVAWGSATGGEGTALLVPTGVTQLHVQRPAPYADTNSNAADFRAAGAAVGMATPGVPGSAPLDSAPVSSVGVSDLPNVAMPTCIVPGTESSPSPAPTVPDSAAPAAPESPPSVVVPVVSDSVAEVPSAAATPRNTGLYAPQLSELLPNPAKPQTDATHEYIELYNANATAFDLSGCILESGTKTKKRYTFPEGTLLAAKSFQAFYTKDTKLSLANTSGQVWLLDPLERVIGQTDAYVSAKDGYAWMAGSSGWQWTASSSPGAINIVNAPVAAKKNGGATGAAAVPKPSGPQAEVRGAATNQAPAKAATQTAATTAAAEHFNPLHPGILAVTGVIAVVYGLYEYRRDVANKFYQFRANRSARRKARPSAEGRGNGRAG